MTRLNAQILDLVNPAVWREKLGIEDIEAGLMELISALTARVAALESALDQAESAIAELQAQEVTVPSLDVLTVDGVNLLSYVEVPAKDAQPVVLESPEEGRLYRVQPIRDDAGQVNFDPVMADTIQASDGRRWRLQVQMIDGVPNLAEPELLP